MLLFYYLNYSSWINLSLWQDRKLLFQLALVLPQEQKPFFEPVFQTNLFVKAQKLGQNILTYIWHTRPFVNIHKRLWYWFCWVVLELPPCAVPTPGPCLWLGIFSCNSDNGFLQLMTKVTASCNFWPWDSVSRMSSTLRATITAPNQDLVSAVSSYNSVTETKVLTGNEMSCPYTVKPQL